MSKPQVASFPQFSRLPTELRLIIWEMAMDEPRTIVILRESSPTPRTLSVGKDKFYNAPEFFFVNQECRTVATKLYTDSSLGIEDQRGYGIHLNIKAKRSDRLEMPVPYNSGGGYLYYVETVECDDEDIDGICVWCDIMGSWLLSLLEDEFISEDGLELCCDYISSKFIYISLRHPFLSLEPQ
ncbi:hypothetical protein F4680DRAFT_452407 [Xylaria scruposa]|nr:hypothetical protein F4680DRAFT_452407 [Xylaria scruposa]